MQRRWQNWEKAAAEDISARRSVRACFLTLLFLWMLVIFWFSSQGGDDSMQTSGMIAEPIAHAIADVRHVPRTGSRYREILDVVQMVVRKTAHFTEYAILGALFECTWTSFRRLPALPRAWSLSALYAVSDEVHQLLQGERSGMWQDVLLDSCGALAGIVLLLWILTLVKKRRKRPEQ